MCKERRGNTERSTIFGFTSQVPTVARTAQRQKQESQPHGLVAAPGCLSHEPLLAGCTLAGICVGNRGRTEPQAFQGEMLTPPGTGPALRVLTNLGTRLVQCHGEPWYYRSSCYLDTAMTARTFFPRVSCLKICVPPKTLAGMQLEKAKCERENTALN